jgi:hypothetical protein
MLKKGIYYSILILIVVFLSLGFKSIKSENFEWFRSDNSENSTFIFPSAKPNDYKTMNVPYTGKFFIGYKEAIAFRESQGKYHKINSLGYMGKYQFGKETLKTIGIHDSAAFIESPKMQEKAFTALLSRNKWKLRKEIKRFDGKIVDGVRITESGILAAAHLGGVGSVKRFLYSGGKRKCRDSYGTSVKSYLRQFEGYETSAIEAHRNPKVK